MNFGVQGINDFSVIAGVVYGATPPAFGYLRALNGSFTKVQDPASDGFTVANGINDFGTVVGEYVTAASYISGFIYSNGTYQTYDLPGLPPGYGTYVMESTTTA